ncbi:MAG TPA: hypothetical protein VGC97_23150 [Pyrinomonadaceae bacterium]|jgi:hypothetical protein
MRIFGWKWFPLIAAVIFILAYVLSNLFFVNCNESFWVCHSIDGENMSALPYYEVRKQENQENSANNNAANTSDKANPANTSAANTSDNGNKEKKGSLTNNRAANPPDYLSKIPAEADVNCDDKELEKPASPSRNHLKCIPDLLRLKRTELDKENELVTNQRKVIDLIANRINEINKQLPKEQKKTAETDETKNAKNSETTGEPEPKSTKIDENCNNPATPDKTPEPSPSGQSETDKQMAETQKLKKLRDEKKQCNKTLTSEKETLAVLENEAIITGNEIAEIRQLVSERYSKRLIFMFFTAAFVILCIAAIAISCLIINDALKPFDKAEKESPPTKQKRISLRWQVIAGSVSLVFGIVVYCFFEDRYLSIVLPMYVQTIWSNGDVSEKLVHFINCFGFAVTLYLVFAAAAVFYAVQTKEQDSGKGILRRKNDLAAEKEYLSRQMTELGETDSEKSKSLESQITEMDKKIVGLDIELKNIFEVNRQQITSILYVGALMLFVGMVRIKLLAEWHLLFISLKADSPFYTLLSDFFNKSIGVQAAFYSLLLLVMYVPVVYSIPGLMDSQTATGQNFLERLGLPFSGEFIKKWIAIFSPVMAGPIMDFLGRLVN